MKILIGNPKLLAGEGSAPKNLLTKYDHYKEMDRIERPHHWRSAPSYDQCSTDEIVFQLSSSL
jgi:hypothetical protein